jgi:hypothetical protein
VTRDCKQGQRTAKQLKNLGRLAEFDRLAIRAKAGQIQNQCRSQ